MKLPDEVLAQIALEWWKCLDDGHGLHDLINTCLPEKKVWLMKREDRDECVHDIVEQVGVFLSHLSEKQGND